ncbi:calcium-binding protein [Azospirillum soli]|uniref:calcium-binding protein n=1 Tax=Azospirillum soli TaxID=1304799 RepID=UPI001AE5B20D|nr:calcium-binding protein [Azospirillum soli]MBP2312184.1 hypothetical protein [Azospirillum soli]
MATMVAGTRVDTSAEGNSAGLYYDNYSLTANTPTQLSYRYTLGGSPVMDISMFGSLVITDYSASGRMDSVVATFPDGRPLMSITGLNASFNGMYQFATVLTNSSMFKSADHITGSAYGDVLYSHGGNDAVLGGPGSDWIDGGDGTDLLYGNTDGDILFGGAGNDVLFGGAGDDALIGGLGNDGLVGDRGNDRLDGGTGNDDLQGLAGADVFIFRSGYGADRVLDFNPWEGDRIELAAGQTYSIGATTAGEAVITLNGSSSLTLYGFAAGALTQDWITFA